MAWPTRGQQAPNFWDDDLKEYIDEGDAAAGAVDSVNGETGVVVLDAENVGAIPADDVTLIVKMTQAEYDAVDPKVPTTLYLVTP